MKLLIVEDEIRQRNRYAHGIEWAVHNIELVDAVGDGQTALDVLDSIGVDIILVDIQMPIMSGLEMARRLRANHLNMKIIVLTGHETFEYARQSIELDVYRYLLKPASNALVLQTVLDAAGERRKEFEERHSYKQLQTQWQHHLPHLKQRFLLNWLHRQYAGWELERRANELLLPLFQQPHLPVLVDMDPIPEDCGRFRITDRSLLLFSLYSIAREILADIQGYIVQDKDSLTVLVFVAREEEDRKSFVQRINHAVLDLQAAVYNCLKMTASAGIGSVAEQREQLPDAYTAAKQALQDRIVLGNNIVISWRETRPSVGEWAALAELEKQLIASLDTGNAVQACSTVNDMLVKLFTAQNTDNAREWMLHMSGTLSRFMHNHNWRLSDIAHEDYAYFENLHQLVTYEQIREWLFRIVQQICQIVVNHRKSGSKQIVEEMIRMVDQRLHEDASLYRIAAELYMNSSYLSRLFKEEMNLSFTDYVLQCRMERARSLLAAGHLVYEAAEQCGFKHVTYFSKTFQKFWGIKPSDIKF